MTEREKKEPLLVVGLHWINASGPASQLEQIKDRASDRWGEAELIEAGRMYYQRHYRWASGAMLCFSEGKDHCTLSINGSALEMIAVEDQMRLLRQLHGLGCRTTRIDVKADDHLRRVPLSEVHAAAEAGHFGPFRKTQPHQPKQRVRGEMQLTGDMRTFGRRGASNGSGCFYRIYDKALESDGEIDAIRWEVEFAQEKAHEVGRQLANCETVEEFTAKIGALVGGNIDFREGDSVHVDRRRRLCWWDEMVELLGAARVRVERVKSPLQAALTAVKRQYANTLAAAKVVCDNAGVDFFSHLKEMIGDACSIFDPRKLDGRDLTLNVSEAFKLRPRRAAVYVPGAMATGFFEAIPI